MSIILSLKNYAIATGFVVLATGLTWLTWPYYHVSPYAFYYLAAVLSAFYIGWRAGAYAILIGALLVDYLFIPPFYSWQIIFNIKGGVHLGVFIAVSAIMVWLIESLREVNARLEQRVDEHTQALQASEELNRRTLQALPAHIAVIDSKGRIISANQAWESFAEHNSAAGKPSVNLGDNYLEACRHAANEGDHDAAQALSGIESVMRGRQDQFTMEYPCHSPQEQLWSYMTVVPLSDPGKGGAVVTHLDITERKLAEIELVSSRGRFAGVVESALIAIISLDADQRIVLFNAAAERMFRCTAAEAVGSTIDRFIPQRFRETHRMHMEQYRNSGVTARAMGRVEGQPLTGLRMDGEEFFLEASISKSKSDTDTILTVMLRDITDVIKTETQLRINEDRMNLALRATRDGVWDWAAETDEVYYSSRWKSMLGYKDDEIEPHLSAWERLVHPDDMNRTLQHVQDVLQGKCEFSIEFRMQHKKGHYVDILSRGLPLRHTADGPIVRIVGTHYELTEQKRIETELREADRRKNEFLAILAHELRNPLAPISNAVHILKLKTPPDPVLNTALELIERQINHMVRLIDDLLDVSRITHGRLQLNKERTELKTVLNNSIDSARPHLDQAEHTLTVLLPPKPVYLNADSVRLTQAFLNLLNNAANYTPQGGRIEIVVRLEGTDVIININDNGIGIPEEHLQRIFELFSQVKGNQGQLHQGLGIGLALTKELVLMHGGSIEARSKGLGQGSQFIVRLPILVEAKAQADNQETKIDEIKNSRALLILVVDDFPSNVKALSMLLEMYGHQVVSAYDGLEAVNSAAHFQPDVVLLDIGLPKIDGYEACKRIREIYGNKKPLIVAMTGLDQESDRQKSEAAGFDLYLVKPVKPAVLLELLENSCNEGPS